MVVDEFCWMRPGDTVLYLGREYTIESNIITSNKIELKLKGIEKPVSSTQCKARSFNTGEFV